MRKIAIGLLAALVLGLAPAGFAQGTDVNVGWVYFSTPKPGMVKQLEEGRKKHMEFHRKQGDSWTWLVWEIMTGESTGAYLSTTFGHSWKDLDGWETKMGSADTADGQTNLSPYVSSQTASLWMVLKDSSHSATTEVPKMQQVNHFLLKPGTESDFNDAIRKINDAINKTDWPIHYTWYALQDGGEGPHYVLTINLNGWADLAEPTPSFDSMLEKAVGKHDASGLIHSFDGSVKREWTETIRLRPELSYMPAAAK
jgi:hypothetical protein